LFAASLIWLFGLPGGWVLDDHSLLELHFPEAISFAQRPLTYLTFWLNFALGPNDAWAFRLTNIAIHAASVQLCYSALKRLLDEKQAFWATLVFAIHPLQSEAVLYIFARPILLMGALVWAALAKWLDKSYVGSLSCFALALLAKEEAIAFPVFLLLLHLAQQRNKSERPALAVAFALALAAGLLSIFTTTRIRGSGAGLQSGVSPLSYLATQVHSIFFYFADFVIPIRMSFDDSPPLQPNWVAILWIAPLAYLVLRRNRPWAVWVAAALVFLLPTSSVFPLADLSADRRMYIPTAFLAIVAIPFARFHAPLVALFTIYYCRLWSNNESLWRNSYEHTNSLRPALELSRLVTPQEARRILASRATQGASNPNYHTELGRLAMQERNAAEALRHFGKALALDPDRASHYYNRGAALFAMGQREAALADFERTLKIDPGHQLAQRAIQQAK
jgi:tetratricopeptide (TPR) repeat protein